MAAGSGAERYEIHRDGKWPALAGGAFAVVLGILVLRMPWHDGFLLSQVFLWAFCLLCLAGGGLAVFAVVTSAARPEIRVDRTGFRAPATGFRADWPSVRRIEIGTVELRQRNFLQPAGTPLPRRRVIHVVCEGRRYEFQLVRERLLPVEGIRAGIQRFAGEVPVQVLELIERREEWNVPGPRG
ncbi:hypothetical protein GCM10018781_04090 [Kitasatospora indigofera]|uniref:PH domain-containing protein n=1 Tax=Kitasatospora indigofera TaxID=67307 RepID=A0A919FBU4_9ACTN|nr:hypothetical protein [Kitasatospora indigofera]GHH59970.1 hypothetical protein GCM10018781_04090 [Kitasatospora indigofera]